MTSSFTPIAGDQSNDSVLLQYESLRLQALNRQPIFSDRSLGFALFIRKGMLSWIEACHRCVPVNFKNWRQPFEFGYETTAEIIKVMANITLFNLEEALS